ncbi:MAG: BlaI/MecI/CopY family transcriptional regulator [Flavobacteriales bacterium]
MNELTKAEEQIMQIVWQLGNCFVKEIVEELPEPKPAYNTVSTIVRILEKKEFIGYNAFGKTHQYYALISKDEYANHKTNNLLGNYFGGSVEKMMSFFVKENKIDLNELDDLLKHLKNDE